MSNERAGTVTILDTATGRVVGTVPVGARPRGTHVSADGRKVYVALSSRCRCSPCCRCSPWCP
ncbi:MAG TPA: hypothetical protein VLT87_07040 [Thermoanaerobaculia bacterium]|nr:hypothetical protein [Thermoanaerobaculia bacterium]